MKLIKRSIGQIIVKAYVNFIKLVSVKLDCAILRHVSHGVA